MEIRNLGQIVTGPRADPAASADGRQAVPRAKAPPDGIKRELTGPLADRILQDSGVQSVDIFKYRVQLDIDGGTGRVVAEVRSKDTGELVRQVPSDTVLRHAAMLKEAIGTILDVPS